MLVRLLFRVTLFYPSLPPVSLSLILKGGSFWISFGERQKNATQGFPHLMVSSSLSFWFCLLYPHTSFVLGCVENGKVLTLQCHTSKKKSAKEINHFCQSVPRSSKAQSRFGALESWTACSRNKKLSYKSDPVNWQCRVHCLLFILKLLGKVLFPTFSLLRIVLFNWISETRS